MQAQGRSQGEVMARPSKYTPDMCDAVLAAGEEGLAVAEMAKELGVSKQTLHNWASEHEEFLDAFTRAKDLAEAFWAKRLRDGLSKPPSEFQGPANLKYMSQRFQEWSEKSAHEHTGKGGGPIVLWGAQPDDG